MSLNRLACTYSYVTLTLCRSGGLGGSSSMRSYHCKVARLQQSFIQRRRHLYDQMKEHLEGEVEPVSYTKQQLGWEKASRPPQAVREYLAKRLSSLVRKFLNSFENSDIDSNAEGDVDVEEDRQFMWFQNGKRNFAPMFLDQMKPWMKLHKNVSRRQQIPPPVLPEVAVVGRSNCGKSTLVNTLAGRQNSKTSKIPGSTESLLFWKMGKPPVLMLVDLPGYGFAYQGEEKRTEWTELSLFYLSHRSNLKRVLVLIDARRGLMQSDREMISFLERYGVKWQVIVTKCDLLKPRFLAKRLVIVQQILDTEFKGSVGPMIPLSALAKQGVDELRIVLLPLSMAMGAQLERQVLNSMKLDRRTVVNGIEERLLDMREAKRVKRVEKRQKRLTARRERLALTRAADMVRAAAAVVTDTEQEKELNRNAASDALKKWGVAFEEQQQQHEAAPTPRSGPESTARREATDLMHDMMGMLSEDEGEEEAANEALPVSEAAVAEDLSSTTEALLCWEDDREEVDDEEEEDVPRQAVVDGPQVEAQSPRLPALGPVVATAHHWNVGKGEDRLTSGSGADPVGADWLRSLSSSREAGAAAVVMDFNVKAKGTTTQSTNSAFTMPEEEERISDDGFSKFPSRYLTREESEAPPASAPMAGIKQYRGKDTLPEGSSYQEQLKKGFAKRWRTEMDDILDEEVWSTPTQEDVMDDTPSKTTRPKEGPGRRKKEWYEPRTATGYIDVKNPKVIPKGTWKWTYLGRPDTVRPLKPKRRFDMADLVNASDIHPRNWRKKASDETWREAKRHWVEWARRRKLVGKAYQIPKEAMTREEVDARSQVEQAQGLIRERKEVVHDAVTDLKQQLKRKRERVRTTGRFGRWDNMFTYQYKMAKLRQREADAGKRSGDSRNSSHT